jgi:dCTP deaminase
MEEQKIRNRSGFSYGMSEAGYDIRIAENIIFTPEKRFMKFFSTPAHIERWGKNAEWPDDPIQGNMCLASTIEEFQMPSNLVGIVHDKSTWARLGLSVFNTVIEPGWKGFLTLELVFHGSKPVRIKSGTGIAQVVFHQTAARASYTGKYQNAESGPQEAKFE